jgi:hypothetical protein
MSFMKLFFCEIYNFNEYYLELDKYKKKKNKTRNKIIQAYKLIFL